MMLGNKESNGNEKDKILERLAANEEDKTPWSELRVIVRQKLAKTVEALTIRQEELEREKQKQRQQSDSDSSGEGTGNQSDTPVAEGPESRKRNRSDMANVSDIRLQVPSKPSETSDGPESEDVDHVMADASGVLQTETKSAENDVDAIKEEPQHQQQNADSQIRQRISEQQNGEHSSKFDSDANEIRDLEERIGYSLRTFDEAPFTIQRIAELLAWPEKHYRSVIKFLRAVERVVYVTSTVEEFPTTVKKRHSDHGEEQMAIETCDGSASAPSSLGTFFQASQRDVAATVGSGTNGVVTTRAVAAKAPTAAEAKARTLEAGGNGGQQQQVVTGVMPLDASDTGILHITPTSMDDTEALKSKIQSSVDANVPVFIDDHDGGSSKLTVQPVFPRQDSHGSETKKPEEALAEDKSESSSGASSDANAESEGLEV
ncbi:hypothetical protein GGF39_003729 [Coemansia sp. RSA 1721]|nr:hypothetical protein GGF39_003729 [Coemansia sp. RSA 1721]